MKTIIELALCWAFYFMVAMSCMLGLFLVGWWVRETAEDNGRTS